MIDPLQSALRIAGAGLEVQSARLRVVSENVANAQSTGSTPGADPYARKTITFEDQLDRSTGMNLVHVKRIGVDPAPFQIERDPGNPSADEKGFVRLPNVNILTEMADMREANHSYEANLQVIKQSRDLLSMTIDLLRTA